MFIKTYRAGVIGKCPSCSNIEFGMRSGHGGLLFERDREIDQLFVIAARCTVTSSLKIIQLLLGSITLKSEEINSIQQHYT